MILSRKSLNISESSTLAITALANQLKAKGVNVIGFGAGEPDFDTPDYIKEAAIKAIKDGRTKYTPVSGIPELKEAIINKFKIDNNLEYKTSQVLVSNGAKHSLYNAMQALCNPGDEVLIPTPYWVTYPELVKMADATPVFVRCDHTKDFRLDLDDLKAKISPKTKAIIINSPNNPTGAVYPQEDLEEIAKLAIAHDFYIISDEIYEELIYDGRKHISIASLDREVKDHTIVVNGVSKAYSMTGWRIGYAAGPEEVIKVMTNIQSHATSNPNSIAQYASLAALRGNKDDVYMMRDEFELRRNYMVQRINNIKYLSCNMPHGAFYIMMNIQELKGKVIEGNVINSSEDVTKLLLEKANVAVVPGDGFGTDDFVRLSYATSIKNIKNGLDRIEAFISSEV
ncbi:aspartate aminotransferase [Caldanaerobius fijiensis DSM 17918]|uniref:Aminotransferase n=1 Tax=Caldanaerobius fijiensis DSM 17918 TaxID=1121256 RepID=A0A1M4YCK7_9THEO|nr:pyridoxal phosphate-dependent aminotransferase [Caldanaerobius fijiensis]SHF03429.1 aspartate aminotransferase [Caldanaerobius fijiensis DSM 17918]